jgi:hypothetical protein
MVPYHLRKPSMKASWNSRWIKQKRLPRRPKYFRYVLSWEQHSRIISTWGNEDGKRGRGRGRGRRGGEEGRGGTPVSWDAYILYIDLQIYEPYMNHI